ncbi:methionine synthase [Phaeacidiphilus oryzae]|uniref:methionine synthase n=1 Tax=Phaeacidiphilus oryzae TaxID=348818 RepID=UPI00068CE9E7
MPGTDAREAARTVAGELSALPHLPELPARGPGADMIGRSLGLLVELWARVEPSGWRFGDRPGRDTRRAHSFLGEDLDALEEFTQGYQGPVKVQAVGPWTLAAGVELHNGQRALADPGACRDIAGSLAEGLRAHLDELRRRIPGGRPVLQFDEPSLPAVLAGTVRTASGWQRHRAVEESVAEERLRELIGALGVPAVVHCCAPGVPIGMLRRAGASAVSLDWSLLRARDHDSVGEAVEAGTVFLAGVVPAVPGPGAAELSDPAGTVSGVRTVWKRLGLDPGLLARRVVVTPTCGLAGADPAYARRALAHGVRAARSLADAPE